VLSTGASLSFGDQLQIAGGDDDRSVFRDVERHAVDQRVGRGAFDAADFDDDAHSAGHAWDAGVADFGGAAGDALIDVSHEVV
jgi:hypothetical protein